MNKPYSREEIERAVHLRDVEDVPWAEIAALLDRPIKSLHVTASRYRRGLWSTPTRDRIAAFNVEVERLVEGGTTDIRALAAHFGMPYPTMHKRLANIGFDAETLREAGPAEGNGRSWARPPGGTRDHHA